ncbi:MAG: DUF3301 domain-containing protein [Proteobacteria bacterium]|nr:DUF3301 domain-containing protein [Burkholderiales bacterium]
MTIEVLLFVAFGAAAAYWFDSMRAREAALAIAQRAVEGAGCQLLDATVALASLRVTRNDDAVPSLRRVYRFEFSDDGTRRLQGSVTLNAYRLERVEMEPHREPPPTWTVIEGGRHGPH